MKIIVDAFGGDNCPLEVIKGCALAVEGLDIDIVLTGIESEIRKTVNESADFAESTPEPDPKELYTDVMVEKY